MCARAPSAEGQRPGSDARGSQDSTADWRRCHLSLGSICLVTKEEARVMSDPPMLFMVYSHKSRVFVGFLP